MNWIIDQINANAPSFSLLTFLIGLLVGNWLSVMRDKRKEFNDIAIPNYIKLKKQIDSLKIGNFIAGIEDFHMLEMHIPWHQKRKFFQIALAYKDLHLGVSSYDPSTGSVTFDTTKMKALADHASGLLPYLKRR